MMLDLTSDEVSNRSLLEYNSLSAQPFFRILQMLCGKWNCTLELTAQPYTHTRMSLTKTKRKMLASQKGKKSSMEAIAFPRL